MARDRSRHRRRVVEVSRRLLPPLVFSVLLAAAWELYARVGGAPLYVLAPTEIIYDVVHLVRDGTLLPLVALSTRRALMGFAIGASLGVAIGLLSGVVGWFHDIIDGPVGLTYPLPKIALFPALAVLLGFDDTTRVAVIAFACFYPAYLNAYSGTQSLDEHFVWVARNADSSRLRTFLQVILPASMPRALVGVRISLALSFVLMFATEVIGFSDGLGGEIFRSRLDGDYSMMWAGIATIAAVGFAADQALRGVSRCITRGQELELAAI